MGVREVNFKGFCSRSIETKSIVSTICNCNAKVMFNISIDFMAIHYVIDFANNCVQPYINVSESTRALLAKKRATRIFETHNKMVF